MKQREKIVSDEQIKEAYEKYETLHIASSELGMTIVSLWRRAKKIGLAWKDKNYRSIQPTKIPTNEILEGKHPYYQTLKLKKRLVKEGIKEAFLTMTETGDGYSGPIIRDLFLCEIRKGVGDAVSNSMPDEDKINSTIYEAIYNALQCNSFSAIEEKIS